jgi:hypothetical protein
MVVHHELLARGAAVEQAGERAEDGRVLRVDDVRLQPGEDEERPQEESGVADGRKVARPVEDGDADPFRSDGLGELIRSESERAPTRLEVVLPYHHPIGFHRLVELQSDRLYWF